MRVAVLGASGTMGRLLAQELGSRGHDVVPVSRSAGVDVLDQEALTRCLQDVETVVDCLNLETLSGRRATSFFEQAAASVAAAAPRLKHVVVLSILNVDDPRVRRFMGYYRAKYAHERAYLGVFPGRTTVVRTTQWFELGRVLRRQMRVGPLAFVPALGTQPVDGRAAAQLLADAAEQGPSQVPREVAGPEAMTFPDLARAAGGSGTVVGIPLPSRLARTGLLPGSDVPRDLRTIAQWSVTH